MPHQVVFNGETQYLHWSQYMADSSPAILLYDKFDNRTVTATVRVDGIHLGVGEVFIKDYSENEGVLTALEAAGILQRTGRRVQSGFVWVDICKLLVEPE